jgi:prevent-host-death family protein
MIATMDSREARTRFRDILDATVAGKEVVIERYNKPTAVVVNYELWQRMRREFLAMLNQRSVEMHAGDYITQEQLDAELQARGLA